MNRIFSCCTPRKEDIINHTEEDFSSFFVLDNTPRDNITHSSSKPIKEIGKDKEDEEEEKGNKENVDTLPYNTNPMEKIDDNQVGLLENQLEVDIVTKEIIKQSPSIKLQMISGNIFNDKELIINAAGLINGGLRKVNDSFTYFGNIKNQNDRIINDYIITLPDNTGLIFPILFYIYYNLQSKAYFLSPGIIGNYQDATIFLKLEKRLKVDRKIFLSLGLTYFSAEPDMSTHSIRIEMMHDKINQTHLTFKKEHRLITIGRGRKSDIMVYSNSYSRTQTTIEYDDKEKSWFIMDGIENKHSTNGTWLFLNWEWQIDSSIQFRIGPNLLQISPL